MRIEFKFHWTDSSIIKLQLLQKNLRKEVNHG